MGRNDLGGNKMKVIIYYKSDYQMTLNGVNEIQSGSEFITFKFANEQVTKGEIMVKIDRIANVRFD